MVDVIVGNKVIAENEPLVTAQAPDDLGIFSKFTSDLSIFKHCGFDWLDRQPIGARAKF